jgi:hypothetical protein
LDRKSLRRLTSLRTEFFKIGGNWIFLWFFGSFPWGCWFFAEIGAWTVNMQNMGKIEKNKSIKK